MGNNLHSGFQSPDGSYLKELRAQYNREVRNQATTERRKSTWTPKKKDKRSSIAQINSESVRKFIISNPAFLDDFITQHISQDRIKAWINETKDTEVERVDSERKNSNFAEEVNECNSRYRQLLIITRRFLLYPFKLHKDEVIELIERANSLESIHNIESHLFEYTGVANEEINKVFLYMVKSLLGDEAFPMQELCYFLATLHRNYFNVEYHNYNHALSHAQSMFWILKKNPGIFSELEMKSLMIASLAHDVGHPGLNENYMRETSSAFERMYQTPLLERHHTQVCFLILQDMNCNVFCNLGAEDYETVLADIEHDILSTNLHRYTEQRELMQQLMTSDLDFTKKNVRDALKSVLMMACDLCASWKIWSEHEKIVWKDLYEEFFNQGVKELKFGFETSKIMNRTNKDQIPKFQVGFMEIIVMPILEITSKVLPNIHVVVDAANENLERWKTLE